MLLLMLMLVNCWLIIKNIRSLAPGKVYFVVLLPLLSMPSPDVEFGDGGGGGRLLAAAFGGMK